MLVSAPNEAETDIEWQSDAAADNEGTPEEKEGADIKDLQEALVKATG
jgi:hypothetical protein